MSKKDKIPVTDDLLDPPLHEGVDANVIADINADAALQRDSEEINKIRNILSSSDISGGIVRLERRGPIDQQFAYVDKIPVDKFDIDYIKAVYGGGDYRARTFRSNGQLYKPFEFSIDHRVKGRLDDTTIRDLAADKGKGGSSIREAMDLADRFRPPADNTTPLMMRMMDQQKQSSSDSMSLMIAMMTKSQESMAQMMTGMMTAMATMMTASRPAQAAPAFDFAAALTPILIEMVKSPQKSSMLDTLEVVRALKELSSDSKDDKEESMFEKLIRILGPMAAPLLTGRMPMPGPGMPTQPVQLPPGSIGPANSNGVGAAASAAPGSGGGSPVDPRVPMPAPGQAEPDLGMVRIFIEQLYKAAERRSDVSLYVDLIFDTLTDAQLIDLQSVLTQADWSAKLFPDVNRFAQHQVWFNELRLGLLSAMQAGNEPEAAAPITPTAQPSVP